MTKSCVSYNSRPTLTDHLTSSSRHPLDTRPSVYQPTIPTTNCSIEAIHNNGKVSHQRLAPTSDIDVGETFVTAKPVDAIHRLLKLPDHGASPHELGYVEGDLNDPESEHCTQHVDVVDTHSLKMKVRALLLGGNLWLEAPHRDDKLVSELVDELKKELVWSKRCTTPPTTLDLYVLRECGEPHGDWMTWNHPHTKPLEQGNPSGRAMYVRDEMRMNPSLTLSHYFAEASIAVSGPCPLSRYQPRTNAHAGVIEDQSCSKPVSK